MLSKVHPEVPLEVAADEEIGRANRTVFLGNVSTTAITSKAAKKALLSHLGSFFISLSNPKDGEKHKVESIRFRSTPYSSGIPKKASFVKQELMDATTKSTNAYVIYSSQLLAREAAADASALAGNGADAGPAKSPKDWGWHVESAGAYYVFLRHPFSTVPSDKVAQALAELVGVVTLPGAFFMPEGAEKTGESSGSRLRVSVANVATERLAKLPERLAILSELWEKKGAGWGV